MSSAKVGGVTSTPPPTAAAATTAVIDRIQVVMQFLRRRRNLAWAG